MGVTSDEVHIGHDYDSSGMVDNVIDDDFGLSLSVGIFENDIFHEISEYESVPMEKELQVRLFQDPSSFE